MVDCEMIEMELQTPRDCIILPSLGGICDPFCFQRVFQAFLT